MVIPAGTLVRCKKTGIDGRIEAVKDPDAEGAVTRHGYRLVRASDGRLYIRRESELEPFAPKRSRRRIRRRTKL